MLLKLCRKAVKFKRKMNEVKFVCKCGMEMMDAVV